MSSPSQSPMRDNDDYAEDRESADTVNSEELVRQIQAAANTRSPTSIDMALSLEHELDAEHELEYDSQSGHEHEEDERTPVKTRMAALNALRGEGLEETAADRRVSLDPQVLARIVENLRQDLARITQDRDALLEAQEGAPQREKELREMLDATSERCASQEAELEQLRRKGQEDEEQINMLRSKVEESRRGLMRLQADANKNKRQSVMSVDTGRANGLLSLAGPSSSKRASFTPLTGSGVSNINGHRRISSISEPPYNFLDDDDSFPPPSTGGRSIATDFDIPDSASTRHSRRASAFYGGMPLHAPVARSTSPSPPQQHRFLSPETSVEHSEVFKTVKKQCDDAVEALTAASQELQDAIEAREASEQCVVALRAFISEHGVGESGTTPGGTLKLPPMPSEDVEDEEDSQQAQRPGAGGGFSFGKLFGGQGPNNKQPSRTPSNSVDSTHVSPPIQSPPPAPVANTTSSGSNPNTPPANANAFSRAFGGLFGGARKDSISSINSTSSAGTAPTVSVTTPTATNAPAPPPPIPADASGSSEYNSSTETAVTQSTASIAISTTPDFLPPRLPNGLRERRPIGPQTPLTPPAAEGQQVPTLNGLGSDSEEEPEIVYDGTESVSVDDAAEPESPETSFSKQENEHVKVHDSASVNSASEVLGAGEVGKADNGIDANGVKLTFA